jgi:CRP-like cAMP-binding protein
LDAALRYSNRLLCGLAEADRALLQSLLSPVTLPVNKSLEASNRRIAFVYFPESGLVSTVARGSAHHAVEIGLIGNEGMTGLAVMLGAGQTPHESFVQATGAGWRIAAADLRLAMNASESLRDRLLCYAHTLTVQMGYTALANARYKIEERLARWLLMGHDRASGDQVILTHEFLAMMLGTRRPGVTTTLNLLERAGLVRTERGRVTILDRAALEEAANGCYGGAEAEYARLFPSAERLRKDNPRPSPPRTHARERALGQA